LYCEKARDPFARAVVVDATRVSRGVSVKHHLPVQVPCSANYAGGVLVLALLFFWLFPTIDLTGKQEQCHEEQQRRRLVERTRAAVEPVVNQQFDQLRRKHPALKDELDKLEPLEDARIRRPRDVINEPIKQINRVSEQLKDRQQSIEMGQLEEFKKLARRAQQRDSSPVGRLAKAMASGDFKSARDALEVLKLELSKTARTEQDKQRVEELKQQLEQLAAKLEQAAESDKKNRKDMAEARLTEEEIAKALEHLKKKDFDAVKKMLADKGLSQKQIDKLMDQMKKRCAACSMASTLAQNLGLAAQASDGAGQLSESAMAGFADAGEQLSEMESLEQELNQLTSAMDDLQRLKDQLGQGCAACGGTGMKNGMPCSACQGTGLGAGCRGPGPGMGRTPGQGRGGIAPEQATNFKTVRERTKVNTLPGRIISTQFVDGEQFSGPVSDEFVEVMVAEQRDVQDAIASEQLPRVYHKSLKAYFDHSLTRLPTDRVKAAQDKANQKDTDADAE